MNGLVCEKNNPESLANCIYQLISNNDLREKFGKAGYEKYQREYTIHTFEKEIVGILQGVKQ